MEDSPHLRSAGEPAAASVLMTSKTMELPGVSGEHGIKLNVEAPATIAFSMTTRRGNCSSRTYRTERAGSRQFDDRRVGHGAGKSRADVALSRPDRKIADKNRAGRARSRSCTCSISSIACSPASRNGSSSKNIAGSILRPSFDEVGWEPKSGEPVKIALLRASLIRALGDLDDKEIVEGCRDRFKKYVADPKSLAPDCGRRSCLSSDATQTKRPGTSFMSWE